MKLYFGIGKFIGKNVAWLSLVMVSLGVLFPEVLDLGTPFVVPLFAFMTFQNSLTNRFENVADAIKHPPAHAYFAGDKCGSDALYCLCAGTSSLCAQYQFGHRYCS